jgi:hypothetical protein
MRWHGLFTLDKFMNLGREREREKERIIQKSLLTPANVESNNSVVN